MSNTSKRIIAIAAFILVAAVIAFLAITSMISSRIPDGTIGNTAGNLNNHGLFCECNGVVYFSNPYDGDSLYRMNPDGSQMKKLNNMSVSYLNVGGEYVIFYGKSGSSSEGLGSIVSRPAIYSIKNNGRNLKALTMESSQSMLLVNNKLYYQHYTESAGTTLAVINLDDKKSTELLPYMINPAGYYNGKIYYNGMYQDHYLYSFDVATNQVLSIWQGNIWNPIYDGNYVYYMDVMNNYRLCRYSIATNSIEVLTNDRIDFFNLYSDMIYYQKSSETSPALKRMRTDGSENEIVMEGTFTEINITSTYVFFTEFGKEIPLYCTPTLGGINVTEFTPAKEILYENLK